MKRVYLYILLMILVVSTNAQKNVKPNKISSNYEWGLDKFVWSHIHGQNKKDKPFLDFEAIENWENLPTGLVISMSPNGQFFSYGIQNHKSKRLDTLVLQSTINNWRQTITNAKPGFFSADNKQYIFNDLREGLCFLQISTNRKHYVKDVITYKLAAYKGNEWLALQLKSREVILLNLENGKELRFANVSAYDFDKSNQWIIFKVDNAFKELILYNFGTGDEQRFYNINSYYISFDEKMLLLNTTDGLEHVNLLDKRKIKIWAPKNDFEIISSINLNESGNEVLFTTKNAQSIGNDKFSNAVWWWKNGMDKAVKKVSSQLLKLENGVFVQESASLTDNGKYIQFSLQAAENLSKAPSSSIQVDVWSYNDTILQSSQPFQMDSKMYTCFFNLDNGNLIRLREVERIKEIKGNYALIYVPGNQDKGDRFWQKGYYEDSCYVLYLESGNRKFIGKGDKFCFNFSPGGKYLVYSEQTFNCQYYSFNLRTSEILSISGSVPAQTFCIHNLTLRTNERSLSSLAGWFEGDSGVLVYDNYDIWKLDLTGYRPPKNITKGYGYKHNILLSLMDGDRFYPSKKIFAKNDTLLLRAFNKQNKYNGFYRIILDSKGDPELLFMGPYFFEALNNTTSIRHGMHPLKAKDADVWLLMKQAAGEAPNYFITTDFKNYKQLTNFQPHKGHNWLTAELHTFKQLDGTSSQGVLYKPENFDSTKKYPLIISFYGHLSDQLNQFPVPEYLDAPHFYKNPAWMVSHGYLVFTPDIYFTKNQWGPSTVNTIEGALKYLKQLKYVDGQHMAACGHSNGGRYGYYLLTHSRSFAAMSLGSGLGGANIMSASLSLYTPQDVNKGQSLLEWAEVSSRGSGLGNLWQNKKSWLDHTAVWNLDKVTSPLLLFHNNKDADDVRLAVELFISLRRLEKKVWWLQYDKGYHGLFQGKEAQDFTIRTTQFYDHYLKCAPAPRWMTQGIPNKLKGIEARYELDAAGSCALEKVKGNSEFGKGPQLVSSSLYNNDNAASQSPEDLSNVTVGAHSGYDSLPIKSKFTLNKVDTKIARGCNVCDAWNGQYKRNPEMFDKGIKDWELDEDIKQALAKAETARHKSQMIGETKGIQENNDKLKGLWKGKPY